MDVSELKAQACAAIDAASGDLIELSRAIHARPELADEEHFAHDLLTDALERHGFAPDRKAYGRDTAFHARVGHASSPAVAVICEYDALPEIGHACGHNVIAAAGLGAALGAAAVVDAAQGALVVLGTPAEEGGGGKIRMARNGAFDGLAAAMMVHPADADLVRMNAIAIQQLEISFHGRAAHAAAAPQEGRNALDAAVLAYMNVAALRQHIRTDERVHGIFTKGGTKPNIVPHEAAMTWYVRSPTLGSLAPLKQRVLDCMSGGATACGCTTTHAWDDIPYADMRDNGHMIASYVQNAAQLGRDVLDPAVIGRAVVGSTDMGNVSYLTPSIHPCIQVAPPGVPIHTADFATFAGAEPGDRAVVDGAKAMAMTVIDLWTSASLRTSVADEFALITDRAGVL